MDNLAKNAENKTEPTYYYYIKEMLNSWKRVVFQMYVIQLNIKHSLQMQNVRCTFFQFFSVHFGCRIGLLSILNMVLFRKCIANNNSEFHFLQTL